MRLYGRYYWSSLYPKMVPRAADDDGDEASDGEEGEAAGPEAEVEGAADEG